ncbi:MAG: protein kinase, partial [Polyangiaceae bacterium]
MSTSACPRCNDSHPDGEPCPKESGAADAAVSNPLDESLAPGTMAGDYRIEAKLGEGGFGAVYRALHPLIHKAAAVKVLSRACSANPELVARFMAEARVVNQIRHRNIVDVFSFGRLPDGRSFLVMELLDGIPMEDHLKEHKRLSPADAMPMFRGVARALGAAHAAGVVHRDLKPANVFLVR